jgi:membrane protein implicated in regulation of membrane protease activity
MSWEIFYFVCFALGFLMTVIGFLTGSSHMHLPHVGHTHGLGNMHAAHGARGVGKTPWFNFGTLTTFLAWFGGVGFLLSRYSTVWALAALGISVLSGIGGAAIVFWCIVRYFLTDEQPLDPADYDMIGVLGRVTSPVREGGTGEMLFSRDGTRRAVPIREEHGRAIGRDTEVVIIRYERGIAYVQPWDELSKGTWTEPNANWTSNKGKSESVN